METGETEDGSSGDEEEGGGRDNLEGRDGVGIEEDGWGVRNDIDTKGDGWIDRGVIDKDEVVSINDETSNPFEMSFFFTIDSAYNRNFSFPIESLHTSTVTPLRSLLREIIGCEPNTRSTFCFNNNREGIR